MNGPNSHRAIRADTDNVISRSATDAGIKTGTSGTVTTLASVHLALPSYDRRAVDGLQVPIGDMRRISTMISELDFGGRRNPDGQGFAAFGKVVSGMDLVRQIHARPASGQQLNPPVRIQRAIRLN